jgi:hypothetical protein
MSTVLQWVLVAAIVVVAGAYAARALMPPSWRRALAQRLRAGGNEALAARLDAGGGCDACPSNVTKVPGKRS